MTSASHVWPLACAATLLFAGPIFAQTAGPRSIEEWLTVSDVSSYLWSPDGRFFYYTSDAGPTGTDAVFRVDAAGGRPLLLSETPPGERPEPVQQLTISPDGRTLYFAQARHYQAYTNLYRMSADGGPAEQLTFHDAVIQTGPAPSPDGHTLAFWQRTRRGTKIHLMDLDRPSWTRLLNPGEGQERGPSWSSDGKLAYTAGGRVVVQDGLEGSPRPLVRIGSSKGLSRQETR